MNQTLNNRTVGLVLGIILLTASLCVDWLSFTQATLMIPGQQPPAISEIPITLTGLNGSAGVFGIQLPIWSMITAGVISFGLTLLNLRNVTSLPRVALAAPALACVIYIGIIFVLTMGVDTTLHLGPVLAAFGLAIGIASGKNTWLRAD